MYKYMAQDICDLCIPVTTIPHCANFRHCKSAILLASTVICSAPFSPSSMWG